ncbi:unnamed protein product [Sphagnum troendelagicum]|uniref:Uncharacterized protein n=1 Tax=Sphagnum troendelagicum TaxID=128251 RepID=A0ABP0UK05_9BRYO
MDNWARERRVVNNSTAHQQRANLLQSIAARRQAQQLCTNKDVPILSEAVTVVSGAGKFDEEARLAAIEFLPDSSEESGLSGDEETVISSHSNSTSGLSESQLEAKVNGRRRLCKVQAQNEQISGSKGLDCGGTASDSHLSVQTSMSERLSASLNKLNKGKNGEKPRSTEGYNQLQSKEFPPNGRKGMVQRTTVVQLDSDSEGASLNSLSASVSQASTEYSSAVDDDVDSYVVWNTKQKIEEDMVLVDGAHRYILQSKIAKILYPHQCEGIRWLWGLHVKKMGGILGDDMGLGKTMQIASFLAGLFYSRLIKCAVIVAPKTLIAHWAKELASVGLARKTHDYSGTSVKAREYALECVLQVGGVLLTTYDMVRCNSKALRGDFIGRDGYGDTSDDIVTWDYIILDEGHLVKNPNTQRAKSLREIPAAHRIVLSGTPIQNRLQEMWALFDFCCPDLLGDRKEFKEKYERQIVEGTDKHASDRQKRIGFAVAEELRQQFAPFFLRRLKSEVFPESEDRSDQKLSRKNDLIVWLRPSKYQQKLYTAFLNSETAEESWAGGRSALAALAVMKKICDHPSLLTLRAANDIAEGMEGILDSADVATAEDLTKSLAGMIQDDDSLGAPSCKIVFLMALLENLIDEGHRTLIFSQTRKMLDIIQSEIVGRGWCFRRIDGTLKAAERELHVHDFQADDQIPLFLLTSQVGGLGLTLTGADRVVIVDPAWNPSTDNQSVDRAYRIGQMKDVIVYRLMTCGTVEEKIYRKQVYKGGLMKVATETKDQMRYFSHQELRELFQVPKTGFDVSVTQQQLHKEHASQHRIDEGLQKHIVFLQGLGIAGVSHHDLLFSKAAEPVPPAGPDDKDLNVTWEPRKGFFTTANAQLQAQSEHDSMVKVLFLRGKLNRLWKTFNDKATLARLPDRGANIEKKIQDLTAELEEAEPHTTDHCSSKSNHSHANIENSRFSPKIVHIFQLRMYAVERRKSAIVRYSRDGFSTLEGVVC